MLHISRKRFLIPDRLIDASISEAISFAMSPKDMDGFPRSKDRGMNPWDEEVIDLDQFLKED